ncbi:MAG: preprotein translocase subunit SecA [Alphaproteobacteria bacterium]|nr:preprotein translocase subunit SecA [Alphaproteobacteria bacterium]
MLSSLGKKIFGSSNDRLVRALGRTVETINGFEPTLSTLSDEALTAKTTEFRTRLNNGETVDALLPEAFAVVREAAKRVLGMRHFDVQLIGGMVQHKGMISEMKTGEGKTLVATLAAYLNALPAKGVHIVTVNDYLARRDAEWMGKLYRFLGLSVGVIMHGMDDDARRAAYGCDITYATNNELGFDYLRDNMKYAIEDMVQRPFHFAIIDEVDSILIDEARTPLIISGPTEDNSELYYKVDALLPKLISENRPLTEEEILARAGGNPLKAKATHQYMFFDVDEKNRNVTLSDEGVARMEELLAGAGMLESGAGLYDIGNVTLVHHVNQALRAHTLFKRDVDYIVKDGKVVIIDEFTGRMMEGRRYSEGLHQALEAKEGVRIENENQTLASITFQNYFRMYPKLAGMTGTAMTEAGEFMDIYKLEVVEIPTNVPVTRIDDNDEIYRTSAERDRAVIKLIKECNERGQPMLIGTVSIEKSESFSALLKKEKIKHQVLNARFHEQEAQIISQAGRPGAVTIATNMAGRGTDIMLGGNAEMRIKAEGEQNAEKIRAEVAADKQKVLEAGGLYVIATERHESRRIDNQLRGRSGRQGDPGASKFFLSLQDDLMRIFGSERIDRMLVSLGLQEDEAITHPWMNKAIERAQTKVEQHHYEVRKTLLKFDNVMNDQRKVIYDQRIELMQAQSLSEAVDAMREEVNDRLVRRFIPERSYAEEWDGVSLQHELYRIYGLELPCEEWVKEEGIAEAEILERVEQATKQLFAEKAASIQPEIYAIAEKRVMLQTLDQVWKDHLLSLDHMRQGINLRAYAQKDPLNEYKHEAFNLFSSMISHMQELVVERLARMQIRLELTDQLMRELPKVEMHESRYDPAFAQMTGEQPQQPEPASVHPIRTHVDAASRNPRDPSTWGKVGRNDDCPCGSGKKFKHCHGKLA